MTTAASNRPACLQDSSGVGGVGHGTHLTQREQGGNEPATIDRVPVYDEDLDLRLNPGPPVACTTFPASAMQARSY
jgi:hypothetical protein